MKFRTQPGQITIRLIDQEFEIFVKDKYLKESILKDDHSLPLSYSIQVGSSTNFTLNYVNGEIKITIPEQVFDDWQQNGGIGVNGTVEFESEKLDIVVEKDLKRKKRR